MWVLFSFRVYRFFCYIRFSVEFFIILFFVVIRDFFMGSFR